MAMMSGQGIPHSSGHSLLCTLLQVYEVLCVIRKESFVSLLKQRTFEVGIGRILSNWACWLHPSIHIWCEPQICKASLCHPKILCDLAGWQFLKCYFKSQKRETWKCRLSIPERLDTHIQLWDTIHYCSDTSPAVINRWRLAELSRWRASALGMNASCCSCRKPFSKINIVFCFPGWILKTTVKGLLNLTASTILTQMYFLSLLYSA